MDMFFLSVFLLAAECDELLGGGNAVRLIFLVEPRGLGREEGMRRVALVLLEIFRHGGDALAQLGDGSSMRSQSVFSTVSPALRASQRISLFEYVG